MTNSSLMYRGIVSLLALVFCAPDLFGEDAAAVDAARRRQREILLREREQIVAARAAQARQPFEWFAYEFNRDGDDPAEIQPVRRARIASDWLDRVFFGQSECAVVRGDLEAKLSHEVEWLGGTCGLSAVQMQKLLLAGRGDIKRQFERIGEMKEKVRTVSVDSANLEKLVDLQTTLVQQAALWRTGLSAWQFGDDTLFAKARKRILTPEQIARHAQWVRDHPVVVTRSWDLRVTR